MVRTARTWHDYFVDYAALGFESRPPEPLDAQPCDDCAAGCMYRDVYANLRAESLELQEAVLGQSFCHTDSRRRCRGAQQETYRPMEPTVEVEPAAKEVLAEKLPASAYHDQHIKNAQWHADCETCGPAPQMFFVVWADMGGPPTIKYTYRWSAEIGKSKMSKRHPGTIFHVLKSKSSSVTDEEGNTKTRFFGRWNLRNRKGKTKTLVDAAVGDVVNPIVDEGTETDVGDEIPTGGRELVNRVGGPG